MSLDGFIARSNDEIDWAFKYGGSDQVIDDVIKTIGAVVLGKRTFEVTV
jgi:dihydrofolate reductase